MNVMHSGNIELGHEYAHNLYCMSQEEMQLITKSLILVGTPLRIPDKT